VRIQLSGTNQHKYIYLFRHGETNWNIENRIIGQLEDASISFTKNGLNQIKYLVKIINELDIETIFSSDLIRAQNTSIMINDELNIPISFHKELRGLNMGKYQGLSFKGFLKEKEIIEVFNDYNKPIPGGESINQLNNRLFLFIKKIVFECPYENIAIVSHGTAISNLKAYISGDSYIHIDRCVLLYKNNEFKVMESNVY
jgi:broad specificity phosphatase PhoE